jgi:crotonobetainyl-CoA:carnitine CoA-transferase CaiB-like acyl-CoA transferase
VSATGGSVPRPPGNEGYGVTDQALGGLGSAPRTPSNEGHGVTDQALAGLRHPLDGVRVLELANYIAGPYCGMVLGDYGAEVIKVENPRGGDFSRLTSPFVEGESAGFIALNRNKKSVALDLKAPRGREIFLDLVRTVDVLIENFRPGTMEDLGIAYPVLAEINPRLIYSAATGFGQTGPYSQRAALDLIVQGMSGLMSITGEPGRPPVKVGVPIADLAAALFGASAIIAALYVRDRTGQGQQIDISLLESAIALEAWETSGFFATGQVPERLGSAHRVSAPYQAFHTADGYVTVGATTPGNWSRFCNAMGLDDLEHDARFSVLAARRANYEELADLIEDVTTTRPSEHWYRLLEGAGVPCGVLNTIEQMAADEHVQARGFVVDLPHSKLGRVRATGSPVRLSRTPVRLERAGPLLGEHTEEVLTGLGVSVNEITELAQAEILRVERAIPSGSAT